MLNKEFYETVVQLRQDRKTWEEVRKFLVKTGAVHSKATGEDVRKRFQELAARVAAKEIDLEQKNEFQNACDLIDEAIGRVRQEKSIKIIPKVDNKILILSDPHIPFVEHELMWQAVEDGVDQGCNILVINGDYLNGDALSSHAKFKHQSLEEEVAMGAAILEKLRERFEIVYLLDDNHIHDRWRRWMGEKVPADRHFLLVHPYDHMVRGMDNVIRAGQTHDQFPDELSHFMILGDCLFSHGFVSGKDGESARKVQSWYRNWKFTLGLPEVRVYCHGHSHCLGVNYETNGAVIQTGTLASLEGLRYAMEGTLKYTAPIRGYSIIEQSNGITNLSTIRVVKF